MTDRYPLPTVDDLIEARFWLQQGAPAAARNTDAPKAVRVLLRLLESLPGHLPEYAYGSEERKRFEQRRTPSDADIELVAGELRRMSNELLYAGSFDAKAAYDRALAFGRVAAWLGGGGADNDHPEP